MSVTPLNLKRLDRAIEERLPEGYNLVGELKADYFGQLKCVVDVDADYRVIQPIGMWESVDSLADKIVDNIVAGIEREKGRRY